MTRVISLSDDAYNTLKMLKKEGESFSEVVRGLASSAKKKSIIELWGGWAGGVKELDRIEKKIYAERKRFKLRKADL
ncbi:antitoxin VapB family protein [Candidatus Woesearchaeota archaeon]|nr:antitoxin VapB family protein [Candidatus Woesearchaeota archaeon]